VNDCHIDVGRENRYKQERQTVSSKTSESREKQSETSQDFSPSADPHEHLWMWKKWRDDSHIGSRMHKVEESAQNKNAGKHEKTYQESDSILSPSISIFAHGLTIPI